MPHPTCSTCRFHESLRNACRKNPPTLVMLAGPTGNPMTGGAWPPAKAEDWCGAHEPEQEEEPHVDA